MRYIDADKLKDKLLLINYGDSDVFLSVMKKIDDAETADVRENVTGNWIKRIDNLDYGLIEFEGFECSLCGVKIWKDDYENIEFNFCPNCGADMRSQL